MVKSSVQPKKLTSIDRMQMQCSIHNATWYVVMYAGGSIKKDHKKIMRIWEETIDSCIKSGKHPYPEFIKGWMSGQET